MVQAGGHIGLDAHLLSLDKSYRAAGVSHYIYHLLQHLPAADQELRFTAFLGQRTEALPGAIAQAPAPWSTRRPAARILWEQLVAPWAVLGKGIDCWHSLVNVQPLLLPRPAVITIQDLSFVTHPERFPVSNRVYNQLFVRLSAHRARRIMVTSHNTKREIARLYGIDLQKIVVTHLAMGPEFHPIDDPQHIPDFRASRGLPDRFILYVGTIEPRKNLERLVQAFAVAKRAGDLPHHLVIGGGKGWMYDRVYAAVQELGMTDAIHFPGFVPQEELNYWYNAAEAFIYPSLYEGFGLPPLEAMAAGTPVITSNTSSLPEIVGDAALTVDPTDVQAIADAIAALLHNPGLRQEMRTQGLEQAQKFSWAKTARETVAVYRGALSQGAGAHV